jgi:hypothetical protein
VALYFSVHIRVRNDAIHASGRAHHLTRSNPKFTYHLKKSGGGGAGGSSEKVERKFLVVATNLHKTQIITPAQATQVALNCPRWSLEKTTYRVGCNYIKPHSLKHHAKLKALTKRIITYGFK